MIGLVYDLDILPEVCPYQGLRELWDPDSRHKPIFQHFLWELPLPKGRFTDRGSYLSLEFMLLITYKMEIEFK